VPAQPPGTPDPPGVQVDSDAGQRVPVCVLVHSAIASRFRAPASTAVWAKLSSVAGSCRTPRGSRGGVGHLREHLHQWSTGQPSGGGRWHGYGGLP